MAELSITIIPAKQLADGKHRILVRINHKNKTLYITTRFKIDNEKQLKNGRIVNHPDATIMNQKLKISLDEYYDALDRISQNLYTCREIREYLTTSAKPSTSNYIVHKWQEYITNLEEEGRKGTASLYKLTLRYFKEKFNDISLMSFGQNNVLAFEKHLSNKKKLNSTTTGMHMTRLKAIINSAIKDGEVQYKVHPFEYYVKPEVQERNLDITPEEIVLIRDYKTDSRSKKIARDVFMLSYYLGGINLIDLVSADFRNMRDICYIRQKTTNTKRGNKEIRLSIPKEALPIIQRWIGIDGRLNFNYNYSYRNFRNYIGGNIRRIAKDLNIINKRVVYYSARKSFVQHGFELGIPLTILEYSIGQSVKSNNRPIFNYIRFMQNYADEAIRIIIDNLDAPKDENRPSFLRVQQMGGGL